MVLVKVKFLYFIYPWPRLVKNNLLKTCENNCIRNSEDVLGKPGDTASLHQGDSNHHHKFELPLDRNKKKLNHRTFFKVSMFVSSCEFVGRERVYVFVLHLLLFPNRGDRTWALLTKLILQIRYFSYHLTWRGKSALVFNQYGKLMKKFYTHPQW